jgi:gas vesicle protein
MSRYTDTNAGDWLIGTVKRNPEALLVLAAGCALLLRNARSSPARVSRQPRYDEDYWGQNQQGRREDSWREGLSRASETAKDYAAEVSDRVSDTASSYASAASRYAQEGGRAMSEQASRLTSQAQSTARQLSEQPLVVAAFGLAAGAALAALLPSTEIEERALGPAREAIADAAGKTGENLKQAAGEVGERLKQSAAERGLSSEGVKDMAREAAQAFTSTVSGQSGNTSSPSMVPGNAEPVGGGAR